MNLNQAIALSVGVICLVAGIGGWAINRLSEKSPKTAVLFSPVLVVIALASGIIVGTKSMMLADDYRILLLIIFAGLPIAALSGMLLSKRVSAAEARVTQELRASEQALQISEANRNTITWLSHDLRTPLAGVRVLAENIATSVSSDPVQDAQRLLTQVDRLDGLIADLFALSGETQTAQKSLTVSFTDLVSDLVSEQQLFAQQNNLGLVWEQTQEVVVLANPSLLARAVTNVLVNAIAYSKPGGEIKIAVLNSANAAELLVRDQCGGLSKAEISEMWQPGWRADAARSTPGSGLGLAIVAHVIELHGGSVSIQNNPPGCEVRLSIPKA